MPVTNPGESMQPAIVVPAFNRPEALRRLLACLARSQLPEGVQIILSLEGGAHPDVAACAREFAESTASVEVVEHPDRLGLREHILWCGDQAKRSGSVIVLEDDLLVDPWFYRFAVEGLNAYRNVDEVAGIALYAPHFNDYAHLPFEPVNNGMSAYFMQVPCSWGQAWTADQWQGFRDWLDSVDERVVEDDHAVPGEVARWSAQSWKKFFVAYLAGTGRTFVYPYVSYTTHCADPGGTHLAHGSNVHQVALPNPEREFAAPAFPESPASSVAYDAFMEPAVRIDFEALGVSPGTVAVDFYGSKPDSLLRRSDYCLTTRAVRSALARYPLTLRPLPLNVELGKPGAGPIALCRSDQVEDHDPLLHRWRTRLRLQRHFQPGPTSGLSLVVFGFAELVRKLFRKS